MTDTVFLFVKGSIPELALVDGAGNAIVDISGNLLVQSIEGDHAQYRLLFPHYIEDQYLDELTIIDVPTTAWPPTYQVEPLNDVAIEAFRNHGPPVSVPQYQPPSYLGFGYRPKIYWNNGVLIGA